MGRRHWFVILLVGFSLLLTGLILTDLWPGLRGPTPGSSEWYWPYLLQPLSRWWPALVTAALLVAFAAWWLHMAKESRWPLAILVILSFALQLCLIYADRPNVGAELVDRTLSTESNGYFPAAAEIIDLNDTLRNYPAVMGADIFQAEHARTHPPGLVVVNWVTINALARLPRVAAWMAEPARLARCTDLWVLARPENVSAALWLWSWLPPLVAALACIPAYALGRRLYAPRPPFAARLSAVLTVTLPALLVFSPTADQLYAVLALLALLWLQIGLQDSRLVYILLAGLVVSLMTFFSLGNAVWGLLLILYILWRWRINRQTNWQHLMTSVGLFSLAVASLWLIYWWGWGVPPWAIAREGLGQHYTLVTSLRHYDWWVGYNLLDFLLFAGPLVVIGLIGQAAAAFRSTPRRDEGMLAILLLVTLILLDLSGSTRGEVGRLWLVFMPLAAVLTSGFLLPRVANRQLLPLLLTGQLLIALAIGLAWKPLLAVILPTPQPPAFSSQQPTQLADVTLIAPKDSDETRPIRLLGYDLPQQDLHSGEALLLTLYWEAERPTVHPYTVFTHLIDSNGTLVAQQDNWPVQGQWPPTCWRPSETVFDDYAIQLSADLPAGQYTLLAGMYDAAADIRLRTADGQDSIRLGEITITD